MSKELLTNYIDAVVTNDNESRKVIFGQYLENKTKEVLGFKFVEPQGEPVAVIGTPAATVTESFLAMLSEAELTDEIGLDGNTVTVHGKPVDRLS